MKFLAYNPDQIELLPPSVREVLGKDHLCFFVRRVMECLDLSAMEQAYSEGRRSARLSPGAARVGVAVRVRVGDYQFAAPVRDRAHRRMRRKLRDPVGRALYQRRKATVEPVIGVLKEQRGMRRFRLRGLAKVGIELALASTAYNLTRLWRTLPDWDRRT